MPVAMPASPGFQPGYADEALAAGNTAIRQNNAPAAAQAGAADAGFGTAIGSAQHALLNQNNNTLAQQGVQEGVGVGNQVAQTQLGAQRNVMQERFRQLLAERQRQQDIYQSNLSAQQADQEQALARRLAAWGIQSQQIGAGISAGAQTAGYITGAAQGPSTNPPQPSPAVG